MTDRQLGVLRFDIAERVELAQTSASIQGLDEVEMVPEVEVHVQGDTVLLKGALQLRGSYEADNSEEFGGSRDGLDVLEHSIPVNIALPLRRVASETDIMVEIENFDVDLLSPRAVLVTGQLVLSGISDDASVPEANDEEDDDEEMVFVDTVDEARNEDEDATGNTVPFTRENDLLDFTSTWRDFASTQRADAVQHTEDQSEEQVTSPATHTLASHRELEVEAIRQEEQEKGPVQERVQEQQTTVELETEISQELEVSPDENSLEPAEATVVTHEVAVEEKKEMKIAFGSRKPVEQDEAPIHLASIFTQKRKESGEAERAAVEASESAARSVNPVTAAEAHSAIEAYERSESNVDYEGETEEDVDWRKMLRNNNEEARFAKLRLCIVQKDETLETIAKRFSVDERDILQVNKLETRGVEPGQLLYLPTRTPAASSK